MLCYGTQLLATIVTSVVDVGFRVKNKTCIGFIECVFWREELSGGKPRRKSSSESELSIWREALKTIHFTRTKDLTLNMANSTLIKSIDIHYKTPRPL